MKYLLEGEESKRLRFRKLREDDFENWLELFKNADIGGFLGMEHILTPEKQCEEWFKITNKRYNNNLGGMNVLIHKTSNELVGQCGLLIQEVDGIQELEVGYSVIPKYWNQGYASEAAQKCRDFAFENSFCDSLISIIHIDNIQSEKVAVKNGMSKTKRTEYKKMPVNIFRITREEWKQLDKK